MNVEWATQESWCFKCSVIHGVFFLRVIMIKKGPPLIFGLQANADPSVISCMHNLSRRVAIALQHEERRCQYLTREAKLMLAAQEEITTMTESEIQ